jgi:O-antigen/teichoic acid export membrane protein
MSFFRHASVLTVNRGLTALLSLSAISLSTRLLTSAEYGNFVAVIAVLSLLMRISSLGLGQAAQYFAILNTNESAAYLRSILLLLTPLLLLVTIFMLQAWLPLGRFFFNSDYAIALFGFLAIGIPSTLIYFIACLHSLGRHDFHANLQLSLGPLVVSILILCVGLYADLGWITVLFSYWAQFAMSFILGVRYLLGSLTPSAVINLLDTKRVLRYGLSSYLVFLAGFIQNKVAILGGALFARSEELAFFAVANTLAESLLLFYGSIGPLIFSYSGQYISKKDAHQFIGRVSRTIAIVLIVCSLVIATVSPWLMSSLFGPQYSAGHTVTLILLPAITLCAMQRTLENYLYGREKQAPLVFVHTLNVLITFTLSALLTPLYGAHGLALASLACYTISFCCTLLILWRVDGLSPAQLLVPRCSDITFIMLQIRGIFFAR